MSNNRNRIIFPAEYGRLQPQLAPAVQGGEPTYTIYLLYQDGTVYSLAGDETLEIIYQDTSDDAVYSTTTGLSVSDAEAGIVTWQAAAALGLAGSFRLQLKVNDETSLRVRWKVEAALDASGTVPPVAMTSLTAAQVALVQTLATLSGLANFNGAGSATAIKLNLAATTDPTADDDSGDGYTVWSGWANVQDNKAWLCLSAAAGAAVWLEITGGGAVWGSITGDLADQTDLVAELDAISSTITTLGNLIAAAQSSINTHMADTGNPHQVTAAQIGAGTGDVSAAANIPDNRIVTGDGGNKDIQGNVGGVSIDDSGRINTTDIMFGSDTNARFSRGAASRIDAASSLNVLGFVYAAGNQALARNGSELSFAAAFATVYSPTMYRWYVSPGGGREYTRVAVDGSAQTIISNGAGDVLRGVYGQFVYYDSAGNFNGGVITPTPVSSTFDLVNDGTNILRLTVAADGSVTIARAGGSRTYDVNIRLMWL